jgi:hypothetical protein
MSKLEIGSNFKSPIPKRIRVGQLGEPAGITSETLALLKSGIPSLVFLDFDSPLTELGMQLLINRFRLPVIQEGHVFRPIGGFRILTLLEGLASKEHITVDMWDPRILEEYSNFALQEALLTNLLFGLDTRSAHDQLRKLHAALGIASCSQILKNASSRLGFEKEFGINRRAALDLPESQILNFARVGIEDRDDE